MMASDSNQLHGTLSCGSMTSPSLEHPEDTKAAWPSDLLNINDPEMAKLFDPNCDHFQYHDGFQEEVSSSVSLLPPNNESLESIIQDLVELSQPVLNVEESIVKEAGVNYPVELIQPMNNSVVNVEESIVKETGVIYPVELIQPMNNSVVNVEESIVKETGVNYPVELIQPMNNSVVNVEESIVKETGVKYPVELIHPLNNSVVNVEESIVEEIGVNHPDSTEFLANNEDSPMPSIQFTNRGENWEALAVMSLSPEVLEGKQETLGVGYIADSNSVLEAVTPDDPIVVLKTSVMDENVVPSYNCGFLSAEAPNEISIQPDDFGEESTEPAQEVIETILMKLETVETSSPYCSSDCAPTSEGIFAVVSVDTETGMCSPQPGGTAEEQKSNVLFTDASMFSCDSCDLKFVKITNLFRHTSAHTKSSVLCCDVCDLTFISVVELLSHNVAVHDCSDNFTCDLCQLKVATYPELLEHVGRHDNKEPFQCSECSLLFRGYSEYCRHCQGHTQEILFECVVCSYLFRNESDRQDHEKFLHSALKEAELSSDNKFMCEVCGELFSELNALKEHASIAHETPQFTCGTCGKSFLKSISLTMHHRKVHSKPHTTPLKQKAKSRLECGVCQKKFHNMSVYSRHISTHKTRSRQSSLNAKFKIKVSSLSFSEKDFVCEICNALFSDAAELRWHIQDAHFCETRRKDRY